ncbi:MAG: iron-sulfur cluster assembly accessory protein [Chloroflexi bacterium]|nr:iron-sulfur cluster assembly accessory protein [Chloroflexota bacterium]
MISITENASERVRALLESENKQDHALRIFVRGMSCSGPAYGMALDNTTRPDDTIEDLSGIKVVVDPRSAPYVEGAEIDYVDSLVGQGFTINNPNAAKASGGGGGCGGGCTCGH